VKFIDEADVEVEAGRGGNGCVAFRRERFKPKGGPSGGDGGRGGDVLVEANTRMSSLLDLRFHPLWKAGKGRNGSGNDRNGRSGRDAVILVPAGTVVTDAATGETLADLVECSQRVTVARGGRGGRGNLHFKGPTRRAPDFAEPGREGEKRTLHLEIKLLADVGVLGFPNLGKSTLVRRVSAARPRVADYPFTTLVPTLGVVRLDHSREFVIADMPGLIRGAADGAGLGHRFLRHVERTSVLCHMVTVGREPGSDPVTDHAILNAELARYSPELASRRQVVALNKIDLPEVREHADEAARGLPGPVHLVSAATGEGVDDLLEELWKVLDEARRPH
jgi:GTP-binding protein